MIGPQVWICATGIGLYIAYVPANTIFFERMLAVFRYPGNAGFIGVAADFFGSCGSIGVLFYKNFYDSNMSYVDFFYQTTIFIGTLLLLSQAASALYFLRKARGQRKVKSLEKLNKSLV